MKTAEEMHAVAVTIPLCVNKQKGESVISSKGPQEENLVPPQSFGLDKAKGKGEHVVAPVGDVQGVNVVHLEPGDVVVVTLDVERLRARDGRTVAGLTREWEETFPNNRVRVLDKGDSIHVFRKLVD